MKRQRIFAVLAAAALILTAFSCKTDAGTGDSGNSSQPGYVGKIYSARDGQMYLKIDSKDKATLAVWVDGTAAQPVSRAAATTGSYIFRQGEYTISIKDGRDIFSLKLEWTANGKSYSYEIVADLTNGTALANFKINGEVVIFEETTAAPEKPSADSSGSGSSSGNTSGGGTTGGSSGEEEPDYSNIPVPEGFVRVPDGVSRDEKITSFFMSDHEVTRVEYKDIIGTDPSDADAYDKDGKELKDDATGNNPVNSIKWYEALVYCNKRSLKENLTPCYSINDSTNPNDWGDIPGANTSNEVWVAATCNFEANGYRLPTEAEWQWAARGGESYKYAGSDDALEVAWCYDNTDGTRDIKTKKANAYGLYDMSGNVWEWCWDSPSGASYGAYRVVRGGSYDDVAGERLRVTFSIGRDPGSHSSYNGFRVARTITK